MWAGFFGAAAAVIGYLILEYYVHKWWLTVDWELKEASGSLSLATHAWYILVWLALGPIVFVMFLINVSCFLWLGLSTARDIKRYIDS